MRGYWADPGVQTHDPVGNLSDDEGCLLGADRALKEEVLSCVSWLDILSPTHVHEELLLIAAICLGASLDYVGTQEVLGGRNFNSLGALLIQSDLGSWSHP